jgi:hypothetical protein
MKIRFPAEKRATWRDRFVEISRAVDAGMAPPSLVVAAGLKARARTSSTGLRHARPAA